MIEMFRGPRPDVTPAQAAAVLVAGVPAVATLLSAFGVYELERERQDALSDLLGWSSLLAGLLIGGDATLRSARNVADARREATRTVAGAAGRVAPTAGPQDPEVERIESSIVVSDDEEFFDDEDGGHLNGRGLADNPDLARTER